MSYLICSKKACTVRTYVCSQGRTVQSLAHAHGVKEGTYSNEPATGMSNAAEYADKSQYICLPYAPACRAAFIRIVQY